MIRKLILAAVFAIGLASPALAQNTTCSDRPSSDNSNACANTRFVHANGGPAPVIVAANFGQADWCANLDAAIASLAGQPGEIWVGQAANPAACSGTGDITLTPNIKVKFIDGSVYTLNRNIHIGQGDSLTGNASGNAMAPLSGRSGTELLWTGTTAGANGMIKFFDSSFSAIQGLIINCNMIANCVNVTYDSDNNPPTSFNTITDITFLYGAVALQVGLPPATAPPTIAACTGNFNQPGCYEMDTLTMNNWRIYGAGSTAQGITVNSMNALQMSKISDGNIQSVNIGIHQIFSNPGGTTWLERVTSGTLPGANSAFYRADATAIGTFTLHGNETEGNSTYSVWASSCPAGGARQTVLWTSNSWNDNILVDGCFDITSVANNGAPVGAWTVAGTSSVYSMFDKNTGAWTQTGSGVINLPMISAGSPLIWNGAALTCPTCSVGTHTIQVFTSASGTYNKPATAKWLAVKMVGGGGGGDFGNGGSVTPATNGTASTFSTFTAGGGNAGSGAGAGAGGNSINGSVNLSGGRGQNGVGLVSAAGGSGGVSCLGGNGWGGSPTNPGTAATANTGSGGGGGGSSGTAGSGGGGGAGGCLEGIISSPAASYSYSVGAGGAGGDGSIDGGAGGSGIIIVNEYY